MSGSAGCSAAQCSAVRILQCNAVLRGGHTPAAGAGAELGSIARGLVDRSSRARLASFFFSSARPRSVAVSPSV